MMIFIGSAYEGRDDMTFRAIGDLAVEIVARVENEKAAAASEAPAAGMKSPEPEGPSGVTSSGEEESPIAERRENAPDDLPGIGKLGGRSRGSRSRHGWSVKPPNNRGGMSKLRLVAQSLPVGRHMPAASKGTRPRSAAGICLITVDGERVHAASPSSRVSTGS
jgi:hypothetical protein